MRALARWTPFRELAAFDPFVDPGYFWKDLPFAAMPAPAPMMRLDVSEDATGYLVRAELPGVTKEDVSVAIDGDTVSITAEAKRENEAKDGEKVLRTERYYGSVARTLTLPAAIDVARAEARFDNGMLTLTLPRAP